MRHLSKSCVARVSEVKVRRGAEGSVSEGDRDGWVRSGPGRGHAELSGPEEGFCTSSEAVWAREAIDLFEGAGSLTEGQLGK